MLRKFWQRMSFSRMSQFSIIILILCMSNAIAEDWPDCLDKNCPTNDVQVTQAVLGDSNRGNIEPGEAVYLWFYINFQANADRDDFRVTGTVVADGIPLTPKIDYCILGWNDETNSNSTTLPGSFSNWTRSVQPVPNWPYDAFNVSICPMIISWRTGGKPCGDNCTTCKECNAYPDGQCSRNCVRVITLAASINVNKIAYGACTGEEFSFKGSNNFPDSCGMSSFNLMNGEWNNCTPLRNGTYDITEIHWSSVKT